MKWVGTKKIKLPPLLHSTKQTNPYPDWVLLIFKWYFLKLKKLKPLIWLSFIDLKKVVQFGCDIFKNQKTDKIRQEVIQGTQRYLNLLNALKRYEKLILEVFSLCWFKWGWTKKIKLSPPLHSTKQTKPIPWLGFIDFLMAV